MAIELLQNKPSPRVGLPQYTFTIPSPGAYNVKVYLSDVPPSGVSVEIKQNSTSKYVSTSLSAGQNHLEFKFALNCATNDVVHVNFSSSSAIDTELNNVKSITIIGEGL